MSAWFCLDTKMRGEAASRRLPGMDRIVQDEEEETHVIMCAICGMTVESVDDALDQDWVPFFYEGNDQHGPVCADCSQVLMRIDEFGEMEIKDQFRGKIYYLDEPLEETGEYIVMGMIFN